MESLPQTKAELLEKLQESSAELDETLSRLTSEQFTDLRDQGGWSIQDHLDHLAVWETSAAMLLERRPLAEQFAAMGVDKETAMGASEDELNNILRARSRRRTAAETRAALRAAHEQLLRALDPLSDADLAKTHSFYQQEEWGGGSGKPAINWVVGNSSGHYREHLPWIQAIAAQGNRA